MAKIAFILLCHKDPEGVIAQANALTAAGDYMAIHYDARAGEAPYRRVREALADNPNVAFAKKRLRCGWGEWSLVQATLTALDAALENFPRASHFYMVSGDCMAIKSAQFARAFLDENDKDYIESLDFHTSDWIKTGLKEDRLRYRHWFNERQYKSLFYTSLKLQRRLKLERSFPSDLQIMIGSQWWCLRRRTIEWILEFAKRRRDVVKFFRTTWIPDEIFFQTLVRHIVPSGEIENRTLTFSMFTEYGMPVTFYNDHYDLLLSQNYLFARKISPDATELKERLGDLYASDRETFNISNEGRSLFRFVTNQGRVGRRFAKRFWEEQASLGRDRTLYVVACKKWHVAKRLVQRISERTSLHTTEYLFDEASVSLPDLGGLEKGLQKRARHRRAFLGLLFSHHDVNRMLICLDPSNVALLRDVARDDASTRLLEIECEMSQDYLRGHAIRVGLAAEDTPDKTMDRLLPSIRQKFQFEHDQMQEVNLTNHVRISAAYGRSANSKALSKFLQVDLAIAEDILDIDYLFED